MTRRTPPKAGLWLLQRLGRGYHSESLMGDLLEQCAQGRTGGWAWREIIVAVFIAQARRWRSSQWPRVRGAFWWCLTEVAVMLTVMSIADQSQNWRTFNDLFAPTFIVTLMVLLSIALIGLRSLVRIHRRQRQHAAGPLVIMLFLVMTLGVGTLTWAATLHHGQVAPRGSSTIAGPTTSDRDR